MTNKSIRLLMLVAFLGAIIRHLKNDTFLFSHEKSRHYKTLKTLDQAISYRDKYLDNLKTSTQQDKTSL